MFVNKILFLRVILKYVYDCLFELKLMVDVGELGWGEFEWNLFEKLLLLIVNWELGSFCVWWDDDWFCFKCWIWELVNWRLYCNLK